MLIKTCESPSIHKDEIPNRFAQMSPYFKAIASACKMKVIPKGQEPSSLTFPLQSQIETQLVQHQ